jgi:hypothetical protein
MGFYDCRCLVSGVSLKGADAALVLLQQSGQTHQPIALAITGNYNRLGCIDGIDEDDNTQIVFDYFLQKLESGDFVVEADYLRAGDYYPIDDVEKLLACFERNVNDHHNAAVLGGRPVVFALISRAVWDALARAVPRPRGSARDWFRRCFAGSASEELYRNKLTKVSAHLQEFAAVSEFLTAREIPWGVADHPGQDYAEEMRQYLAEARRTFADSPVMLEALDDYESEVRDLLEDDE